MRPVFALLLLWAAPASAQTVEGTVVDTITGNGIPGVRVELVRLTGARPADPKADRQNTVIATMEGQPAHSATTDRAGQFRLEGVPEGTYGVRYRAADHIDEAMTADNADRPPRRVEVAAGSSVRLEARMIPLGGLSGRVVDGRGQPVPNAHVDLETGNGIHGQDADKDGHFRDIQFPGDESILSVAPPLGLKAPDPDPDTGRPRSWVRTYYPGVAERAAAGRITGQAGVWRTDLELKLVARPTSRLSGTVLNPDGTPAGKVPVVLGEDFFNPLARVETGADGGFVFPNAADGLWRISCDVERGDTKSRAAEWVEVAGKDQEGVKLRLREQVTVTGRVIMETPQGRIAPRAPMVRLRAFGHGRLSEAAPPGSPDGEGNFRMPYFYPGLYRFNWFEDPPPGYYLDTVRLGESVLSAPDVEITSGALPLTITFKSGGGMVRGTAESCGAGGVLLVPADPRLRWPMAMLHTRCEAGGRYRFAAVRPGDYLAVPVKNERQQFDESMAASAGKVSVREGETASLDLGPPTLR